MRSYSREDSEDGLLSFENISGALQERTGHKVWGGSTLIYSTMAARAEGSADHLLARGSHSSYVHLTCLMRERVLKLL